MIADRDQGLLAERAVATEVELAASGAVSRRGRAVTALLPRTAIALVGSFVLVSAVFAFAGAPIGEAWAALYRGSFGSTFGAGELLMHAGVLVLVALAVAVPARALLWNVGGEGQLYIGALVSVVLGLSLPFQGPITVTVALLGAAGGGALWAGVAALLRSRFGANEVLTTLMLNFLAILLVDLVIAKAYADSGIPSATQVLPEGVRLPVVWPALNVNATVLIAVAAAVVAHVVVARTGLGLKIRAVGSNEDAARNLGLKVPRLQLAALSLGGAFAGLAGGVVVIGIQGLLVRGFSPGYGFVGIAVAMLAMARPLRVIVFAILFASLTVGGSYLEPTVGISSSTALVCQALLVLMMLACWVFPPGRLGGGRA